MKRRIIAVIIALAVFTACAKNAPEPLPAPDPKPDEKIVYNEELLTEPEPEPVFITIKGEQYDIESARIVFVDKELTY